MKPLSLLLTTSILLASPVAAQTKTTAQEETATLELNHIGFAVSKLDDTASFFVDTLGWKRAGGRPEYPAKFVTNGKMFVTLWQVNDPAKAVSFDRKNNVGLHHMAITVRDLPALHDLHRKFVAHTGVVVEFAPEFLGNGPATHMMIREPSGLRLEFIVPASRIETKN
ncbi:MAG: VOC family protein [Parasphingorhabdus sp.]|uniref:VOC family protein n=1 Tax=Parasphingorhabdus sp. TaxID=2709688 RepID=UPI00329918A1